MDKQDDGLVARLRGPATNKQNALMCIEAADEITRLRAEVERLSASVAVTPENVERICVVLADQAASSSRVDKARAILTTIQEQPIQEGTNPSR